MISVMICIFIIRAIKEGYSPVMFLVLFACLQDYSKIIKSLRWIFTQMPKWKRAVIPIFCPLKDRNGDRGIFIVINTAILYARWQAAACWYLSGG